MAIKKKRSLAFPFIFPLFFPGSCPGALQEFIQKKATQSLGGCGLSMTRPMLYSKRILIAGDNDDFHLFAVGRRAESIGGSPAIGGEDNLNLVELPAGRAGDPQFAGGLGKFNFNGLSTRFIAAIDPLLKSLHINPHPFHAKP